MASLLPSDFSDFRVNPVSSAEENPAPQTLEEILSEFDVREEEVRDRARGLEEEFVGEATDEFDPSAIREPLTDVAQGITKELFAPGGPVDQQTGRALRATVESGFGPTSGGFDQARSNILGRAVGQITNRMAQAAPQLARTAVAEEGQRLTALGEASGRRLSQAQGLLESQFGGQATLEQLRLAKERQRMNERILEEFMGERGGVDVGEGLSGALSGGATGAMIGSVVPGIGTAVGAAGGGILGGLSGLLG